MAERFLLRRCFRRAGATPGDLPPLPASADPAFRSPLDDGDDGEAPWHDPALPIVDRMKLAEGRPVRRRMMAAMAQQDCGQCGYNCEDYSNAIAMQAEDRLNLCVPGGKETARMLKSLIPELGGGAIGPEDESRTQREARARAPKPPKSAGAIRARLRRPRPSSAARGSTRKAPRRRRSTSSSICPRPASIMSSATVLASMRRTIPIS